MPCDFICAASPVSSGEATKLWDAVTERFPSAADDAVAIRCVSVDEITHLNNQYRKKQSPTNVLTFSYTDTVPHTHDIALCMDVAIAEATQRGIATRDYIALLLVHAMLHAVGLDHERSLDEDTRTRTIEREIVATCGFVPASLSDVY